MSAKTGLGALGALVWVAGVILAKGFWWTLASVFLPVVAYFIVVQKALQAAGWVS